MKKLFICILFSVTTLVASSQKVYFVYLQSEADQPFFVKMNERINSSTGSGYLILSKLHDSSYNFSVGFPQNKWPEQNFSISVNKKDHGYLLKNFGEKGWGLFDLQTMAVQMPVSATINTDMSVKAENKNVSAFTEILSKAADDPSLKDKPIVPVVEEKKTDIAISQIEKKEESKNELKELVVLKPVEAKEAIVKPVEVTEQPIIKKEEPKIETNDLIQIKPTDADAQQVSKKEEPKAAAQEPTIIKSVVETEQPIVKEEIKSSLEDEYKKSIVTKKSESSTTEGFGLIFLDTHQNGTLDTIRLIIPNPKPVVPAVKMEPKEDKKFLDIVSDIPKTEERPPQITEDNAKKEQAKEVTLLKQSNNNNCTVVADENDFFKIRKIMAAVETEDEMVSSALNYFKTKCFTVTQIKNLGTLFLTDAGKYKFFDAAYLYVTDLVNFSSLQTELKDEYYINRFKAMLR